MLRGLEREDLFTVVFDQVMTDTARYADVVLPATTFLEHHDMSRGLRRVRAADAAAGRATRRRGAAERRRVRGALPPLGVWRAGRPRSGERVRRRDPRAAPPGRARSGASSTTGSPSPTSGVRPCSSSTCFRARPTAARISSPRSSIGRRPAGSTRIRELADDPRHPLALISPACERRSARRSASCGTRPAGLEIHPEDARGPRDRRRRRGAGVQRARRGRTRRARHARSAPGRRAPAEGALGARTRRTAAPRTRSCPTRSTDLGGGACFNDARVEVERVSA